MSSLTPPIATTPAAEPITRSEPPVPTVIASSDHIAGSVVLRMSIAAAVSGILSKMAERIPRTALPPTRRHNSGFSPKKNSESHASMPRCSSDPTANKIPTKKSKLAMSTFSSSFKISIVRCESRSGLVLDRNATSPPTRPTPKRIPMNGGRPTMCANSGKLNDKNVVPITSFSERESTRCSVVCGRTSSVVPRILRASMVVETSAKARLGRNAHETISLTVNLPASQSMMVVTSPIGENAPPAFAAMTIVAAATSKFGPLKNLVAI